MRIEIDVLDKRSISKGISDLNEYKRQLKPKMDELCMRAAEMGADEAGRAYASVYPFNDKEYGDPPSFSIDVVKKRKGYAIQATGDDVLYLEFGSGARYGYGHPYSGDEMGFVISGGDASYGPGTNSPMGHWDDPDGWWYRKDGLKHSYGNPPSVGMYNAKVVIEENLEKLKEEIFNG